MTAAIEVVMMFVGAGIQMQRTQRRGIKQARTNMFTSPTRSAKRPPMIRPIARQAE
jgi:hypothetical protein